MFHRHTVSLDCTNMENKKRTIAAFDFDGTLTTRDTLPLFIIHARGWGRFICGMLRLTPMLCGYLSGGIPNGEAKQRLFAHFFKGMPYKDFKRYGETFAKKTDKYRNTKMIGILERHKEQGHCICIISASMEEWIGPWAAQYGVGRVIATEAEIDGKGFMTGRFRSPNCNGKEKVKRLLEKEPERKEYYLYAYGDSKGDMPLLEFADRGIMTKDL